MAVGLRDKLILGEFELDLEKRLLTRAGEPVRLTNKPFQVLVYLIEQRARLVTRRELLDRFWEGRDVYDVTLTKCVSSIRKALADQQESPRFIETRWAEGYRYIGPVTAPPGNHGDETNGTEAAGTGPGVVAQPVITIVEPPAPRPRRSRRAVIGLGVAVLLAIGALAFTLYRIRRKTPAAAINSIAVLPLRNLTGDPNNEYLSDGITETLITALSKAEGIKVISPGSVLRFKGQNVDPREVGRQLSVAAVLEGSVRQDSVSVQVSVRLVSAEDGSVLWAGETYNRALPDILVLQNEIARRVAAELQARLTGENEKRLARRYTENAEAYQLYLKGRYFWNKRDPESLKKSRDYFEQAVKLDPGYALAYTGLADCSQLSAEYRQMPVSEAFAQARAYATRALEIDESLAEAHTSLAYTLAFYDWNWTGAEKEFRRAIELNPNYATAHQWYSEYLVVIGRFPEAEAEIVRAQELDPLALIIQTDYAAYYYLTRQYDKALEQSRKTIELEPNFYWAYMFLWAAYQQKNMDAEAVAAYAKVTALVGENKESDIKEMMLAFTRQGAKGFWHKRLEQMQARASRNTYLAWDWAFCYLRLGDTERALEWLQKAYVARDRWIINIKYDPQYDPLRADPRFRELMKNIGLD